MRIRTKIQMKIKTKLRDVWYFILGFITCFLMFALAIEVG